MKQKPSPPAIRSAKLSPKIIPKPNTQSSIAEAVPATPEDPPIEVPHRVNSKDKDIQKIKELIKEAQNSIRYSNLTNAEEQIAKLKTYANRNVDYILNFDDVADIITELENKLELRKDIRYHGTSINQSNITVEYIPNELHSVAQKVLEQAVKNREDLQALYAYGTSDSLSIIVTDKEQMREQQENLPAWASAYYNGSIHLQTSPTLPNFSKISRQLSHEMLHAHLDKACSDKHIPIWVNEGLAQKFEGRPLNSAIAFLQQSLRSRMYKPPNKEFDTEFLHSSDTESARLYSQSLILVSYIEEKNPGFWQELFTDACPSKVNGILKKMLDKRIGATSGVAFWNTHQANIKRFMQIRYAKR